MDIGGNFMAAPANAGMDTSLMGLDGGNMMQDVNMAHPADTSLLGMDGNMGH